MYDFIKSASIKFSGTSFGLKNFNLLVSESPFKSLTLTFDTLAKYNDVLL